MRFCADLSGKEPHRQVCKAIVVKLGSLAVVIVSKLARNTRDVGSILTLSVIFPIIITHTRDVS